MKINEMRAASVADLEKELDSLRRELLNLRMQKQIGEKIKPHLFINAKKQIARINLVIHEKNSTKV